MAFAPLSPQRPLLWRSAVFFLTLVYVSGLIGMQTSFRLWFVQLTPANLLLSSGLLLWSMPGWSKVRAGWLLWAAAVGFAAEVAGVNTGLLFGAYRYGSVLGWQSWNTPFIIAVNWMMVTYLANETVARILSNRSGVFHAAVAASFCTALDVVIEPTAIRLGYWTWAQEMPPMQNYVDWWIISFIISLAWPVCMGEAHRNPMAPILLILQIVFFLAGLFLI
jgi:putative membrane protein